MTRVRSGGGSRVLACALAAASILAAAPAAAYPNTSPLAPEIGASISAPLAGLLGPRALRAHREFSSDMNYSGVATTTLHYFDACGADLGVETTRLSTSVGIGPPLRPAGVGPGQPVGAETNPVHLSVGATSAEGLGVGAFTLISATQVAPPTPPEVIIQYWRLALRGTSLTGTLVEDYFEQGVPINQLTARKEIAPCQPQLSQELSFFLPEGMTLEGTVTSSDVHLRTGARIIDPTMTLEFVSDIAARRTQ